ncbi:hypothetical protein AZ007_004745, partial [Citrobacter freundii]
LQLTRWNCENICYNLDDSFHCGNCCNVYSGSFIICTFNLHRI